MNRLFKTASVLEMAFLASSLVRYWMSAASGSPLKATFKENNSNNLNYELNYVPPNLYVEILALSGEQD
jgi:hypothetical protein